MSEFTRPSQQFPSLSVFLRGKGKDDILQGVFPNNNIRRTRFHSSIGLRCKTLSAETNEPIIFADRDVTGPTAWPRQAQPVPNNYQVQCRPAIALLTVYTRLIFPFANLVFIIASGYDELVPAAEFLAGCISLRLTTTLPRAVRPKVVVLLETDSLTAGAEAKPHIARFYGIINQSGVERLECFSAVDVTFLDDSLPGAVRYEHLRDAIRAQQELRAAIRRAHRCDFNARYLNALFQSSLKYMETTPSDLFDFARAARRNRPVSVRLSDHVSHFMEAGVRSGCSINMLIRAVASALLIDYYMPDIIRTQSPGFRCYNVTKLEESLVWLTVVVLEPLSIFRELYLLFIAKRL